MFRSAIFAGALSCALMAAADAAPRSSVMPGPTCNAPICESPQIAPVDRRAAARERASRNGFGTPMRPGETARQFLGGTDSTLAAKISSIIAACPGTQAISTVRHTRIAGTRVMSLHAQGKAVDVSGPYGCIYAQLQGWQGGYSTDAVRMQHIHISLDLSGGREMGLRFVHGCGRRCVTRHARAKVQRAAVRREAVARPR